MSDPGRPSRPKPSRPLIHAMRSMLSVAVDRLIRYESLAPSDDAEGVHQMRVAARRLRGLLRVLGPRLDLLWIRAVSDEVAWLGSELGDVRNLDVLHQTLTCQAERWGQPLPAALENELKQRRQAGRDHLRGLFASTRYQGLRQLLSLAVQAPEVTGDPFRPAGPVLLKRLNHCALALRGSFRELADGQHRIAESHYHEVRKRAKDLRYTAAALAPWLGRENGKRARALSKRLARATDTLGQLQDEVSQPDQLLDLAAAVPGIELELLHAFLAEIGQRRGLSRKAISRQAPTWIRRKDLRWRAE